MKSLDSGARIRTAGGVRGARSVWGAGLTASLVFAAVAAPVALAGQQVVAGALPAPQAGASTGTLAERCAAVAEATDPFLAEVMRLRDHENAEEARAALAALEPGAREAAAAAPNDADAQYRLALVLGAELEHMDGTAKIEGATVVHDQASRVLALSPQHPGASYMLGKLHATVRRMSGLKRWVATSLLGGSALKDASWEQAQALLEVAVREAPCVPEHHFELARVYQARDDLPGAQRELGDVLELTAGKEGRATTRLRERTQQFWQEWGLPGR
jgi:hypothetical protein